MKNKVANILCICGLMLAMCGLCGCNINSSESESDTDDGTYFVVVESHIYYSIAYDRNTKVMYAMSNVIYNGGGFTLLVDADGSPLLYEGE